VAVRPGGRALALLLAANRLGLRVAVADPTVGPDVLRARLALADPALLVADAAAQAVAGWAAPLAGRAHLRLPDLRTIGPMLTIGPRLPGAAPVLAPCATVLPPHPAGDGDAIVVFTSGTTASPRGVVHTRASLDAGLVAVRDLVHPAADQAVLGGTFFVLVPSLSAGAPVALPARTGRGVSRQLHRLRPQATYLTPPQLRSALGASARFTGQVYSGSAPVTASLLARVRAAGADEAWGVYALTEFFPAAAIESADKLAFAGEGDLAGRLLPGVRAAVADDGELMLAGPAACDRYLGGPPLARIATGDIARLVDDGRQVVLAGRAKDMVLRRAVNIYPGLYEPALHVEGVSLAVLVGVPAGDGDERLVAVVEPQPGADHARVRRSLHGPLARMGQARPDAVLLARVPLAGRSRKPDRAAAALLAHRAQPW
ncbi:MAG: AMP-binding protein, partial [Actinomycetota bacterium]|nr:AMP-binding protein [Actinomycetota bacterium]